MAPVQLTIAAECARTTGGVAQAGRFITFEGGEGSGKSTQLGLLAHRLRGRGWSVLETREPGGCPLAEQIRTCLVRGQPGSMAAPTEVLLVLAARFEHLRQVILPALQEGMWVLCDRFMDSMLAYQGYGRGLDLETLRVLQTWAWPGEAVAYPDLTLLLDVPPALGLERVRSRQDAGVAATSGDDRFERESLAFQQRVQSGFLALAQTAPGRFRVIDATLAAAQVENRVWEVVSDVFPDA